MTISNVSSNYLATAMMPAVKSAQSQLATLQTESASGQYADLGLQLGAQSGYELALRNQDDALAAMTAANGLTATNMTSAQNALTAVLSSADDALKGLVTYTSDGNSPATLQTLGQNNLQQLIALGNTTLRRQLRVRRPEHHYGAARRLFQRLRVRGQDRGR